MVTVRAAGAVEPGSVALVLLAGGVGKRMGAPIPKQYIPLRGQPIATFSLETMSKMPEFGEVVVVCNLESTSMKLTFQRRMMEATKAPQLATTPRRTTSLKRVS